MNLTPRIAPSILSADFAKLGEDVRAITQGGADFVHVDVMDGRFVPNITLGPMITEAVRRSTDLVVDTHLMIVEPERYIEDFVRAGSDYVVVHLEAATHLHRILQRIHELGAKAGVALNPHTPLDGLRYVLDELDMVVVMSVNPGFGGQRFIGQSLRKLQDLRRMIDGIDREILVEVDGGVTPQNAQEIAQAGADVLVAGSAVFKAPDVAQAITTIREHAQKGMAARAAKQGA